MKSVAVIGGGITGLTAAFYLRKAGAAVTLYESSAHAGGVIRSTRRDGYLAEWGPNTILENSPKVAQLVKDAELESRRIYPAPEAEARYLVRNGRPVAMPGSPVEMLATELLSLRAKLRVLREPFVPPLRGDEEESVADFVVRRLGREFLDYAIDPLVAGVYAGEPSRLSVKQAFPRLATLESEYGSLIKGWLLGARERKKRGEVARDRTPKFSFDEGLQVLPLRLRDLLGPVAQFSTAVTRLGRLHDTWRLTLRGPAGERTAEHGAVIYAGTAYRLAEMGLDGGADLRPFSQVRHPPVASIVLGFRREDVAHPCRGFGALVPRVEGFGILGSIFSSSLFPNRAPAGHVTLTSYIGGERQGELALLPEAALYETALADLRALFGVCGEPTFRHCAAYAKAIPQYNIGYGTYRQMLADIEAAQPGLYFAGHYRDGISLGDSISSGANIAEKVLAAV